MEQLTTSLAPPRANPKPSVTNSSQQVAGSVAKRLTNELMTLMMSSSPGISAFPKSDGNLFEWLGTIEGPAETIYAGLTFRISISFPPNYPYVAPAIKFDTPCFHPNVDISSGAICLDILQVRFFLVIIITCLHMFLGSRTSEPNNASPLNTDAAAVWDSPEAFRTQLMKHYRPLKDAA
ncbi:ubiquitin-conjugating enzyme/RWD-like protein [Mycena rebaudengoi]|nr:ubiquitin-conjugating enzyme/RWD-like protein [Mycena rebaudengoi]